MPENPTTALVKTSQSPALARVSSQLALTDKLLAKPEEPFLIPYRKGKKWGFCDRNKNIVIDCVYDEIWPFNEGLASVKMGNKYAIINQSGALNSNFEYDWIYPYTESLISTKKNEHWGYINKNGETKIAYIFDWAYPFENGKAKVKYGNLWCLIDKTGNLLNDPYINTGFDLYFNGFSRIEHKDKWGYITSEDTPTIKCKYEWVSRFYNGLAHIRLNGEISFIDINGSEFWQN